MRDSLLFFINGQRHDVRGDDVFLTLADYLRRRARLPGTKIVCAEGDCGSCSVLIGRLNGNQIDYAAVCSCIQMLLQLDGTHVITVEGLAVGERLNVVQQAMVKCHGAQCGYCTPGFIVTMHAALCRPETADHASMRRELVGNLCRCTGYDAILRAADEVPRHEVKRPDVLYPSDRFLPTLAQATIEPLHVETPSHRWYRPTHLSDALAHLRRHPECVLLAGATDLGVVHNKHLKELSNVMSLDAVPQLRGVEVADDALSVGATATLAELERSAKAVFPALAEYLQWFGSPLIKNAGTLAGNLATGSPIGDTLPPLLVMGAELELANVDGSRSVNLNEFYTGYRKSVLKADELITRIRIPLPMPGEVTRFYKISKRKDLDISSFSAAIRLRRKADTIDDIRIAFGGVAVTAVRMVGTEAFLEGRSITVETFTEAGEVASREIQPISDVRGSSDYRLTLARNILLKFFHSLAEET